MTFRLLTSARNSERENAERLRAALLASAPELEHPDVSVELICGLLLPGRQIDLVMLYRDARAERLRLRTAEGAPIHSFVCVIEVKGHSSDRLRFDGAHLMVRYGEDWHDASEQTTGQVFALKTYLEAPYRGGARRQSPFIQSAVWLPRASRAALPEAPPPGSVAVHFDDLTWDRLTAGFRLNGREVRTLVDHPDHPTYHGLETARAQLTRQVTPTRLDRRRVDALTQTRFDAEKTQYIRNLGDGLLMLRGRAGTGKTFALVQIALHLARQGKRTVFVTFNHGLIADISRALRFIQESDPSLTPMPALTTRYAFVRDLHRRTLGEAADQAARRAGSIEAQEDRRVRELLEAETAPSSEFDFALIDEAQDWSEAQRDLMFRTFGAGRVVVADGMDQFVAHHRCRWDLPGLPINRRHRLRTSRRTKGSTCRTLADIAEALGVTEWDLEPDPDVHGGRVTVLAEPNPRRAVEAGLDLIDADRRATEGLKAVDNLVCLPSSKIAGGVNFGALFDRAVEARQGDSWRGFDKDDRRVYPMRDAQLRAVQYQSCRGMEGWTTLCLGMDLFHDFQTANPRIDLSAADPDKLDNAATEVALNLFEDVLATRKRLYAVNWLMIPLTRSVDHLIVHLSDADSALGRLLRQIEEGSDGAIEWIGPRASATA